MAAASAIATRHVRLFLLIEAVRQLRGECGERQIAGAETAIAHGNGGVLSSQSTVILGSEATLLIFTMRR